MFANARPNVLGKSIPYILYSPDAPAGKTLLNHWGSRTDAKNCSCQDRRQAGSNRFKARLLASGAFSWTRQERLANAGNGASKSTGGCELGWADVESHPSKNEG